jgi:hypothetical protein
MRLEWVVAAAEREHARHGECRGGSRRWSTRPVAPDVSAVGGERLEHDAAGHEWYEGERQEARRRRPRALGALGGGHARAARIPPAARFSADVCVRCILRRRRTLCCVLHQKRRCVRLAARRAVHELARGATVGERLERLARRGGRRRHVLLRPRLTTAFVLPAPPARRSSRVHVRVRTRMLSAHRLARLGSGSGTRGIGSGDRAAAAAACVRVPLGTRDQPVSVGVDASKICRNVPLLAR